MLLDVAAPVVIETDPELPAEATPVLKARAPLTPALPALLVLRDMPPLDVPLLDRTVKTFYEASNSIEVSK